MNLRLYISLTALLCGFSLFSQQAIPSMVWGPVEDKREVDHGYLINSDGETFYTMGFNGRPTNYHFTQFDFNTLEPLKKMSFESFAFEGHTAYLSRMYRVGDRIILYFSVFNEDLKKKYYIQRILGSDGSLGPITPVAELDVDNDDQGRFTPFFSSDSTKILISAQAPYERKKAQRFIFNVYDIDGEELWSEDVQLPFRDKYFDLERIVLSNAGEVYVMGFATLLKDKEDAGSKLRLKEDYMLFKFPSYGNKMQMIDLEVRNNFIHSAEILVDYAEGQMVIGGFYSSKNEDRLGGTYLITIDQQEFKAGPVRTNLFPKEFLEEFGRKAGDEMTLFQLKDLVAMEDGTLSMIGEKSYIEQYRDTKNGKITTHYYRNSIIVLNLSIDGKVNWHSVVQKKQKARDESDHLSFQMIQSPSKLHFLYNDSPKTIERLADGKGPDLMGYLRKSSVTMATVAKGGEVNYQTVFNTKEQGVFFVPVMNINAGLGKAVFYCYKGNSQRLVTFSTD